MEESILTSIKKLLGITEEYTYFDVDIIMHINSAFSILTQLGVGPSNGFSIEDDSSTWDEFITDKSVLESVKSYIYMKVRLMFDPPSSSFVLDSMDKMTKELEWRLNATAEYNKPESEEVNSKWRKT